MHNAPMPPLQIVQWSTGYVGKLAVRAIAQAHQGRVELESEEGRGSRFTLWLRYA